MDTFLVGVLVVGSGPTVVYGVPSLVPPVALDVTKGFGDYVTGVLGTGRGRITGTVKETGTPNTPVYRRVRLMREKDGLLLRELWSHPVTGAYSFDYVDELQKFTVLSYDHTGAYNGVIATGLTPELIP